jgi:spore maturation protein CgeB
MMRLFFIQDGMGKPKVLICHPGAVFSTHDTFVGMCAGLEANGVDVIRYPLDKALQLFSVFVDIGIDQDVITEPVDPSFMATAELIAAAVQYEPDAVIAISGSNLNWKRVIQLRELADQRKTPFPVAIYCTESPYQPEVPMARLYDLVFTNERASVPMFEQAGCTAFYLPHAYNPAVHMPGPSEPDRHCDLYFVGTGFEERKALFDSADWSGITFVRHGFLWNPDEAAELLRPKDVTPNEDVVRWYRSATVNLNHHRTTTVYGSGGHIEPGAAMSLGPRAYEIAACRGFQLCDDSRPELDDVFAGTVPTYKLGDSADLERQARYWLAHDGRREALRDVQHDAVQGHSWPNRAKQLLEILLNWSGAGHDVAHHGVMLSGDEGTALEIPLQSQTHAESSVA